MISIGVATPRRRNSVATLSLGANTRLQRLAKLVDRAITNLLSTGESPGT
jgi:hypothetical protein